MMPEDEMAFMRAINESRFRRDLIGELKVDVVKLPSHRAEFMLAGETLLRLARKYPHDDRPKMAFDRWESDRRLLFADEDTEAAPPICSRSS